MKLVDLNDIYYTIANGNFSNDELEKVLDAVKFRRSEISRLNKRELRPGISVKFKDPRSGHVYSGTVNKVKVKYVLVNTPTGRYNVPANMLEVA